MKTYVIRNKSGIHWKVLLKNSGKLRSSNIYVLICFIFSIFIIQPAFLTSFAQSPYLKNHNSYIQSNNGKKHDYNWLQFNFDPQHSGNNIKESIITPENVHLLHRIFKVSLPSVADGAPAYLSNVKTKSGSVNIVYVTTKDGHIIALNAQNGKTIWSHQYGSGNYRINNGGSPTYTTSSPAIDPNLEYVYSYGLDGYVHKYRAADGLEIKSGGWPELCTRKPFNEKGSSALSIATAKDGISYLYVANGGYLGDRGDYQGHLTTINLSNGSQHVFNANCSNRTVHFMEKPGEPDCPAVQSAIWARAGVVYDKETNRIYCATGNGEFNPEKYNWGDAVFALNPDGTGINGSPVDSYTPSDFQKLDDYDLDLGSTAPAIIPTPPDCSVKNLAVQSGKDRKLRLLNLSDLSGRNGAGYTGGEIGNIIEVPSQEMVFTAPAVWVNPKDKSVWVFLGTYNGLAAYRLRVNNAGIPGLKLEWKQSDGSSSPVIANGILFCAVSGSIRALNPVNGNLLWQNRNIGGIHWESPIVDNGVLYISDESGDLTAFGL